MEAIKCDVCGKYYTHRTDESSSVISCVKWIEFGKLKMGEHRQRFMQRMYGQVV